MTELFNTKGQQVGDMSIKEATYYSQRDAKRGEIFWHFGNAVAVDVNILKKLAANNIKFICILIINFKEEKSFYLVSTLDNFLINSETINYDKRNQFGESYTGYGHQRRLPMAYWRRANTIHEVDKIKKELQMNITTFL